jgi:UDPglucose 6-dehydrogenase
MDAAREMLGGIDYAASAYEAAEGADCVVLVTEWDAFRSLDFERLKSIMRVPRLVDLRNVYRESDVKSQGFAYTSIGRPAPAPAPSIAAAAE